jgi:polar amino acid transport system ATP-binding protein
MPMVQARGVHKFFHHLHVLRGVDLDVERGEVVVILGASGSGKTTFLRCLNHLEKIDGGRITVNGHLMGYLERDGRLVEQKERLVARQRAEIGMVFQRFNLFPHMTAIENVIEAPIRVKGLDRKSALARGRERLAKVGLAEKADVYPHQLSGHGPGADALRRTHLGARPGTGGGSPQGDAPAGRGRHDHDRGHPRGGVRP